MFTIAFIPVLIQSSSQLNLELCNMQASSFFSDLQPKNIKQEGTSFAKNEKSSPPVSGFKNMSIEKNVSAKITVE